MYGELCEERSDLAKNAQEKGSEIGATAAVLSTISTF
jgi:hypothetical protein